MAGLDYVLQKQALLQLIHEKPFIKRIYITGTNIFFQYIR